MDGIFEGGESEAAENDGMVEPHTNFTQAVEERTQQLGLSRHDYAMAAQFQHCIMAVLDAISHFHPEICKTGQIYLFIYIYINNILM